MTTAAPIVFAPDSSLWPAFNGATRLPSGGEPKFAEVAIAGFGSGSETGCAVAILCGGEERGGIVLAIEATDDEAGEVSGSLWFGPEVSESAAEALAVALLSACGGPLALRIEALTAAGFRWAMLP